MATDAAISADILHGISEIHKSFIFSLLLKEDFPLLCHFIQYSWFILLVILVTLISANAEYSQDELEAMTEAELEDICVKRGFQLVKDEYGDNLTKQDYIEAAERCLAIEQEMCCFHSRIGSLENGDNSAMSLAHRDGAASTTFSSTDTGSGDTEKTGKKNKFKYNL